MTAVAQDAETGAEGRLDHVAQVGAETGFQRPSRGPQVLGFLACELRSQDFTGAKCRQRPLAWRRAHRPRHPFPHRRELRQLLLGSIPPGGKNSPPHGRASSLHGARVGGNPRITAPAARGRALVGIGVRSGTSLKAGISGGGNWRLHAACRVAGAARCREAYCIKSCHAKVYGVAVALPF